MAYGGLPGTTLKTNAPFRPVAQLVRATDYATLTSQEELYNE